MYIIFNMKEELSEIALNLDEGAITDKKAETLLMSLFGIDNQRELLLSFYLYNMGHNNARTNRKRAESVVDAYLKRY